MTEDILQKLKAELLKEITTEPQVVYLLAGIRKIIERDSLRHVYPNLNFHCDWALHAQLDRAGAKAILSQFDAAQPLFKGNVDLDHFPEALRLEIYRISKMWGFQTELGKFLEAYGLPPITLFRPDGWTYFLHLYGKVIEDIPLVVSDPASTPNISKVVVQCVVASEAMRRFDAEEVFFKISWNIYDKNGDCGEFFVINSFSREISPPVAGRDLEFDRPRTT